jgi:hypothetical protein
MSKRKSSSPLINIVVFITLLGLALKATRVLAIVIALILALSLIGY